MAEIITEVRPVELLDEGKRIRLVVDGQETASAWLNDADGCWHIRRPSGSSYRVDDHDGALVVLEGDRQEAEWWEGSRWLPGHPELSKQWYVAVAPPGVVCLGCGTDLGGRSIVTLHQAVANPAEWHYICDHCDSFADDD